MEVPNIFWIGSERRNQFAMSQCYVHGLSSPYLQVNPTWIFHMNVTALPGTDQSIRTGWDVPWPLCAFHCDHQTVLFR